MRPDVRRHLGLRDHQAEERARRLDLRDAEAILNHVRSRAAETPLTVAELADGLAAEGRRLSRHRLRSLLQYLVLRRELLENPTDGGLARVYSPAARRRPS